MARITIDLDTEDSRAIVDVYKMMDALMSKYRKKKEQKNKQAEE